MSMNLYVSSNITGTTKKGTLIKNVEHFRLWQTPTKITYEILNKYDKLKTYSDWILSISTDEEQLIYSDDDYMGEKDPIGTETYNLGKEHILELEDWLDSLSDEYTIEWFAM